MKMDVANKKVIRDWIQIGGVLGYDTERDGSVVLYVMDDGEFADRWDIQHRLHFPVEEDINEEDFARLVCRSALEMAGCPEKAIVKLMEW